VAGVVSADIFQALAGKAEAERMALSEQLSTLTQAAESAEAKMADIDQWAALVKENSTVNEVDRDLLEALIEKIGVGERKLVDGVKTQDIQVHFKYVGLC